MPLTKSSVSFPIFNGSVTNDMVLNKFLCEAGGSFMQQTLNG